MSEAKKRKVHTSEFKEKVFEIIEESARTVERKFENVLSAHQKKYEDAKIYSNLHSVIQKSCSLASTDQQRYQFTERRSGPWYLHVDLRVRYSPHLKCIPTSTPNGQRS